MSWNDGWHMSGMGLWWIVVIVAVGVVVGVMLWLVAQRRRGRSGQASWAQGLAALRSPGRRRSSDLRADAQHTTQGRKTMSKLQYGFQTTISGISYDNAVARVTDALATEGFGVLTNIDIKATFKKKLDVDFRRYVILGACNPKLAHQALEADPHIGLLLPCNVVVQETPEGDVMVSVADPRGMFALVDSAEVAPVAKEAEARLRRVIDAISDG